MAVKGMVLVMALVFLLVMTLLVCASLLLSQLSHKTALSGQQQLQLSQQALQQHLSQTPLEAEEGTEPLRVLADCPPQYAAWSAGALQCEMLQLNTETYSESRQFYAGYSSLLLKQDLVQQED